MKTTKIRNKEEIDDGSVRTFNEFLNEQYGNTGTVKRKKADDRLKEVEKKQVEKAYKPLKK